MKNRRFCVRVAYVFDLGSDMLPIDVQAKAKGLVFKDAVKIKKMINAVELLTDEGVFSLSIVEQVWARLGRIVSDKAEPLVDERSI